MDWYFAENNQQVGPVSTEMFRRLVAEGRVRAATPIWRDGMVDWQAYQHIHEGDAASVAVVGETDEPAAPERGFCCQCGRLLATEDLITYQSKYICAECKAPFFQRIREGVRVHAMTVAPVQEGTRYAGFWIRFAAYLIDSIAMQVVATVLTLVLEFSAAIGAGPGAVMGVQWIRLLLILAISITYETLMVGKYGATLGKLACGLRIVTAEETKVSYLRAFARCWAWILSMFTLTIGFIIAGFDDQKRALHDHVCGTRVVWKR